MIAIHNNKAGFSERLIAYCLLHKIRYKIVDCYKSDIIEQLEGCNVLFWQHTHADYRDTLFAKQLLQSLIYKNIRVFPDYNSGWHFDDKVAQKYLLESIDAPSVESYVFYDKKSTLDWAKNTDYPKVFKLRGGAGATNVRLVKNYRDLKKVVKKCFSKGFPPYNIFAALEDGAAEYKRNKSIKSILKPIHRAIFGSAFIRFSNRQKGYAYFQRFIPENDCDIRIIVIGEKAFGIKRRVRAGDFRASGSGSIVYDYKQIPRRCIEVAFAVCGRLNAKCLAFDFVFDKEGLPLIVEISYGFSVGVYDNCEGYWDTDLNFHAGKLDPIELIVKEYV